MSTKRGRGFTLIELLVVISIIALLIAILLPALRAARVSAHSVASLSNMRQIAAGLYAYATDNGSSLPFVQRAYLSGGRWRPHQANAASHWPGQLVAEGYIAAPAVFWGPGRDTSYSGGRIDPQNPKRDPSNFHEYRYTSYGANIGALGHGEYLYLNWRDNLSPTYASILGLPLRLGDNQAPPPTRMLLLAEGARRESPQGSARAEAHTAASSSTYNYMLFNYNGALPRAYVDGHATANGRVSSGLIHSGSSQLARPGPEEMGWDPSIPGAEGGGFVGSWVYANHLDIWEAAPWYTYWRTRGWR